MKMASLMTTAAAFSLTAAATADYTSVTGEFVDDGTYLTVQLFANYDDATDITLSVYNANSANSFNQNDGGGGNFLPFFTALGGDQAVDTYVNMNAVDTEPLPNFNDVAADPTFGTAMGPIMPANAGWYHNPNLPQQQGIKVHLGQYVLASGSVFSINMNIGWKVDGGTGVQEEYAEYTTPAPGALALLGLGGLVARRRRA